MVLMLRSGRKFGLAPSASPLRILGCIASEPTSSLRMIAPCQQLRTRNQMVNLYRHSRPRARSSENSESQKLDSFPWDQRHLGVQFQFKRCLSVLDLILAASRCQHRSGAKKDLYDRQSSSGFDGGFGRGVELILSHQPTAASGHSGACLSESAEHFKGYSS